MMTQAGTVHVYYLIPNLAFYGYQSKSEPGSTVLSSMAMPLSKEIAREGR